MALPIQRSELGASGSPQENNNGLDAPPNNGRSATQISATKKLAYFRFGAWAPAKCNSIAEEDDGSTEDGKSDGDGESRDDWTLGQSFSSNRELEIEPGETCLEDLEAAPEVPLPRMAVLSQPSFKSKVAALATTGASEVAEPQLQVVTTKQLQRHRPGMGRRKSKSLITMAKKASEREEQFIFTFPKEQPTPSQTTSQNKRTAASTRRQSKSLVSLAMKTQQHDPQEIQAATSDAVAHHKFESNAQHAQGAMTGANELRQVACNVCGGRVKPHFKFCLFCGCRVA